MKQMVLTMRERAKVLKVPSLASFKFQDLAHCLTIRIMSANLGSTIESCLSTIDLNLAPPLPIAISQGMPAHMTRIRKIVYFKRILAFEIITNQRPLIFSQN